MSDSSNQRKSQGHSPPPFASDQVPLYYQLATLLRQKIISGEYAAGDQLPTEAELGEAYGVSRITVRQALSGLESEDLIRRQAGKGTFVTEREPFTGDLELDRSIDDLIAMGLATSVRLLEITEVEPTDAEIEHLGVPAHEPMLECKRLRYYGEQPYCYIVNRMPRDIGDRIEEEHWKRGSVLKYIDEELGIPLRLARQRLRAVLADPHLARWLEVRIGAPLLRVDYLILSDDGRPVERAQLYYRSDLYSFTLHFERDVGSDGGDWSLREQRFEH